ncbi:hypothetical protein AgCh_009119 [Apium graveolens]
MTSTSSANTPRSGSFDFSWIEHENPSGLEDLQQVYTDFYSQSLGQVGMLFFVLIIDVLADSIKNVVGRSGPDFL